jgi:hypothetical protein
MTVQPHETRLAAEVAAQAAGSRMLRLGRRWIRQLPLAVALATASIATNASGLTIHGGPTYAGSGGVTGSCTVSGNACTTGATVTCSGLNASSFQNLYYGIRNNLQVSGLKQAGNAGPVAGTDQFKTGTGSISYTGTTTLHTNQPVNSNKAVNTALGERPPTTPMRTSTASFSYLRESPASR